MDIEYMYQLDYIGLSSWKRHEEKRDKTQVPQSGPTKTQPGIHDEEIKSLCLYTGDSLLNKGMTIKITLQEILRIIPRKRPRVDSYKSLVRYLHDHLDVELIITSNKTKSDDKEIL